jgi:hypothetical protein
MLRKLGFLVVALGLALPVSAADKPGTISGFVRSASGMPQMGALVEVLGSAVRSLRVFTDENGYYAAAGLVPGTYDVKVSAPSFLPSIREHVGLRAGAAAIVNLTLNTLFDGVQLAPTRQSSDDDDWKWVLRTVSNRPILRVLEDGTPALVAENNSHELKGTLSFVGGSASDGFGSASDMSTGFKVEKSIFASDTIGLTGNVDYNSGSPNAALRASFEHRMSNGSVPRIALTMRRFASPDLNLKSAGLQALALSTSDQVTIGDILELKFGSELQTIQFMGRVTAFRPFGSADLHLSPNTVVEYAYSTSQPDARTEKGFDSAPADLSESGPRLSLSRFSPALEHAHHHELSVSRRVGKTNLQFAVYSDRVNDPALTGVGEVSSASGEVLPDIYSSSFTYRGRELDTRGMRLVLQHKISADLTATLDYGYGGVLDLAKSDVNVADARQFTTTRDRHSFAAKMDGKLPGAKTQWTASYRWTSGQALTPVDWFNASPGQTDPYLSFFIRQPIPGTGFFPGHVEALIDVRNLLAQGYVPVMGTDGRTVYLVQSARSVRGGVAFTF